ncbi:MAG: transposase [Opitutales bacterium]|nr:transposase [Opitutales bacterium]
MNEEAMEAMRHIMRSQAAFAGMEVLTYCFMANHFHIFVRLDPKEIEHLDDEGLVGGWTIRREERPSQLLKTPGLI